MTVLTKPVSSKKDQKDKEALVGSTEDDVSVAVEVPNEAVPATPGQEDVEARRQNRRRRAASAASRRQASAFSQTFLLLTAFLALCIGFIGMIHIFRQFRGRHYYRGFCRIPYSARISSDSMISGRFRSEDGEGAANELLPVFEDELVGESLSVETDIDKDGTIEFDYELDLVFEEFESFELPEISHGRYVHDFKTNQTGIIDPDGNRCFVMPLDRDRIPKPRNLYEVLQSMKSGKYDLDIEEVRMDTRVILPPVQDLELYGLFIASSCKDKTTYELERVAPDRVVVKRSTSEEEGEDSFNFVEFTGKSFIKYRVVNLQDI